MRHTTIYDRRGALIAALFICVGVFNLAFTDDGWVRWVVGAGFIVVGGARAIQATQPTAAPATRVRLPGKRHRLAVYMGLAEDPIAGPENDSGA